MLPKFCSGFLMVRHIVCDASSQIFCQKCTAGFTKRGHCDVADVLLAFAPSRCAHRHVSMIAIVCHVLLAKRESRAGQPRESALINLHARSGKLS